MCARQENRTQRLDPTRLKTVRTKTPRCGAGTAGGPARGRFARIAARLRTGALAAAGGSPAAAGLGSSAGPASPMRRAPGAEPIAVASATFGGSDAVRPPSRSSTSCRSQVPAWLWARTARRHLRQHGRRRCAPRRPGEDGVGQAAAVLAQSPSGWARLAAHPVLLALHQDEQNGIGLLDRQDGVETVSERLHGPACGRRPDTVQPACVAADASQLFLQLPRERVAILGDGGGSWRRHRLRLARAGRNRDDDGRGEGRYGVWRARGGGGTMAPRAT